MKKICLFLTAILIALPSFAKTVSDSLVKNLPCDKISASNIYQRIDSSQFSADFHQSVVNWPFDAGLYDLAACWSLSRTQRLFFYLSRWGTNAERVPSEAKTKYLLDLIRGSIPYAGPNDAGIYDWPLDRLQVFGAAESHPDSGFGLVKQINIGIDQHFENDKSLKRNFRSEIEHYQEYRFKKFMKNLRYVIGTGARSEKRNRQTRDTLLRNLESNRLTLVIIRPTRLTQHVVLAKRFEILSNGDIDFYIYDSNQPLKDTRLTYKKSQDDFFAPEVLKTLSEKHARETVGIYIVDDEEHTLIEKALIAHYTALCQIH